MLIWDQKYVYHFVFTIHLLLDIFLNFKLANIYV